MPRRKDNPAYRLEKVYLRHPKKGVRGVTATDYGRNMNWYIARNWRLVSESRGTATRDMERRNAEQARINEHWSEDPQQQAWRGDKARAQRERSMKGEIRTDMQRSRVEPEGDNHAESHQERAAEEKEGIEEVLKLPWFQRRKRVEQITGTRPVSANHARELMTGYQG